MSKPLVLIFGEDASDRAALKFLVRALTPIGKNMDVTSVRRPLILSKNASRRKLSSMAKEIAAIDHSHKRRKVIVVTHRDCDSVEPAHQSNEISLEQELKREGVRSAVPATPAWEIESWWMHFPEAFRQVRPCWRPVAYSVSGIGMIAHSKERLIGDLRPRGGSDRCPDFKESDGVQVAEIIASERLADDPSRLGTGSLGSFRSRLRTAVA